jgi:hypothetical protein
MTRIDVKGEQLGAGYGLPTEAMFEAARLMARTEGLLLDPVYGGKAFAGLLAAVRNGRYRSGDAILFLMTGRRLTTPWQAFAVFDPGFPWTASAYCASLVAGNAGTRDYRDCLEKVDGHQRNRCDPCIAER